MSDNEEAMNLANLIFNWVMQEAKIAESEKETQLVLAFDSEGTPVN